MHDVKKALSRSTDWIMQRRNVVGCGVGIKEVGGELCDQLALVVMVKQKIPATALPSEELIPARLDGAPTDVIAVGTLAPLVASGTREDIGEREDIGAWSIQTDRMRPARPGISIGHFRITAGTFGAVVYDSEKRPFILSNNHILAASAAKKNRKRIGDTIYQPGTYDGGTRADTVATLYDFVPLKRSGANLVDAALGKPMEPDLVDPDILGIGLPTGSALAVPGTTVRKSGRTTGVNWGRIRVTGATVRVSYGKLGTLTFKNQVITTAMARGGDSGSLILDLANRGVALLFAGSDLATVGNPIDAVLRAFRVTLSR